MAMVEGWIRKAATWLRQPDNGKELKMANDNFEKLEKELPAKTVEQVSDAANAVNDNNTRFRLSR